MGAKWKKELRAGDVEKENPGQCRQCGACCSFISIPPFRADELDGLPIETQHVIDWYTQNQRDRPKAPVPCYFFDMTRRLCLIHDHKPKTCRDFEPGGLACRMQRSDLLGALNAYFNATQQWARHYTRVFEPGDRIQEIGDFRYDDDLVEDILRSK